MSGGFPLSFNCLSLFTRYALKTNTLLSLTIRTNKHLISDALLKPRKPCFRALLLREYYYCVVNCKRFILKTYPAWLSLYSELSLYLNWYSLRSSSLAEGLDLLFFILCLGIFFFFLQHNVALTSLMIIV